MPRLSDSMEDGIILSWLVAEGDSVVPGQPLAEIETDKATVTHEADSAGVILALSVAEGATVPVGAPIAVIGEAGEELPGAGSPAVGAASAAGGASQQTRQLARPPSPPASSASPRSSSPPQSSSPPLPPARAGRAKASPLARRLAAPLNIDLSTIVGSGPDGRVIRADVERAAARAQAIGAANGGAAAPSAAQEPVSAKGTSTFSELTRMQQTVARRMAQARATIPDIELRVEVDMGEAVALRERLREVADPAPSINDFVVKAAALALREFPRVNGGYHDAGIETFARVNVGIAVSADEALLVPTIFDADRKSLGQIGEEARMLAARVRDGSISPAQLSGGTFTVSNLGMHGVDSFSAVINPPQAAILAVGSLRRRPVVDEDSDEIRARPTVVLTLACDHRILYGVDGARFLTHVRGLLERPYALLL
jgi:pyruvate dehydrogenase E2 component (dihydrolipoamide acetyltransferase)